jgi:CheY-like chemotaxis protein
MVAESTQACVLVVEDDELTRAFVVDLIQSFGYRVIAAPDAMEAIRIISDEPSVRLVFTDVAMPGVDGIMLADMVKQHRPDLKNLYTTGGPGVPRVKAGAGILHGNILAKPYRGDDLRREIAKLLD